MQRLAFVRTLRAVEPVREAAREAVVVLRRFDGDDSGEGEENEECEDGPDAVF